MKIVKGGVTAPQGFWANGISCGIKRSGKKDLALIYSKVPAVAAGVFTTNSIKAAPLLVCQKNLRNNKARAVLINSGNANCFTGKQGLLHAEQSISIVGKLLDISPNDVLVTSTGIIGKPLPFDKIKNGAPELVNGLTDKGGNKAAHAILTTDLVPKEIAVQIKLGGKKVTVGACSKGSGMIQPNMATMLAFVNTDAAISASLLKLALKDAVEKSFHRITVDGCMSTNDMVVILANGLAGNRIINSKGKDFKIFCEALNFVCLDMAKKIVLDGEGATKFVEVTVTGAKNIHQAKAACFAIANSVLVKTAAFGSNPNWGRVAAAVGSLGLPVTEEQLKIKFSPFDKKHIKIFTDLGLGKESVTVYTSDLSYDYVKINGSYN